MTLSGLLSRPWPVVLLMVLGACQSTPSESPTSQTVREPVYDFSGHWEVDFSASDSVAGQITASLRQWQRDRERRARNAGRNGPSITLGGSNSGEAMLALANMAEIVTASQLLEVIQTEGEVRVRRENTFALVCDLTVAPPSITQTPFGEEACSWRGRELLFRIALPEGLTIEHQLLLAADRQTLALTSMLTASGTREPVVVRKLFSRYDPAEQAFRCVETLTRGRVCTTESPES